MANRALLIGVSKYESGFNPLPAAVRDVAAMQRVLQDPELGGFDEVQILENPDRQTMENEIEALFYRCGKEDLALLFFSGHGVKDDRGRLYFAPRIARKNKKGALIRTSVVSSRTIHEIMDTSRCRRQAVILDCCYSGAFDPALQPKDDGTIDLQRQLGAEGRVVLTSSSSTEYSFEQPNAELSIYTRYLVEGIETGAGDTDDDGWVSALELHDYASRKVQETAPNMTPKIVWIKDKGFKIFLAKVRIADPKLQYRKEAERYAVQGQIRPAGRYVLDELRHNLRLTDTDADAIEAEILRPYQERLANLEKYRAALAAEAAYEYPLSEAAQIGMARLRALLGLRKEDVLPIQQEVEAQSTAYTVTPKVILKSSQGLIQSLSQRWSLQLLSLVGIGSSVIILTLQVVNWAPSIDSGSVTSTTSRNAPKVALDIPVLPGLTPSSEIPLLTSEGPLTTAVAEQAIKLWLTLKAKALGPEHDVKSISQILVDPALSRRQGQAEEAEANGWHWEYDHQLEILSIETDEDDPNHATVEASLRETAKSYENGEVNEAESYDDNLKVEYELVRQDGKWFIRNMGVVR